MFSIRQAVRSDLDKVCALDPSAQHPSQRRSFIERTVNSNTCFIAIAAEQVVGYGVFEYSFYEFGFVPMLYVQPEFRQRGAGKRLMEYFQSICETPKIFTSTNLSNLPMQSLLAKLGYTLSGVIQHLDENDPEVVYFKSLI